jgi:hypothetical protein
MNRFRNVIATVLLLAALPAAAHEGMHGPGARFDADGSGGLSLEEFRAWLADSAQDTSQAQARFKALDADGDGELSSAEFLRGLTKGQ